LVTAAPVDSQNGTGAPIVVKLGGRAIESLGPAALAREIAPWAGHIVLVHGGGAEVSDWCARLGITPRFADGLRITDDATLEVAVAVLAGLSNKRLVAGLRAQGIDAIGLAALDAGIAEVGVHPDPRLGAVGQIVAVHPDMLEKLIAAKLTPVLASIGEREGSLLNLNADDLAGALAAALGAPALVLLSDTPGVLLGGAVVPHLDAASLDAALEHRDVTGGMRPKLRAARAAIHAGTRRAVIGAWNGPGSLAALIAGTAPATVVAATLEPEAAPLS
jgi:acetylglutamate kinase